MIMSLVDMFTANLGCNRAYTGEHSLNLIHFHATWHTYVVFRAYRVLLYVWLFVVVFWNGASHIFSC